MELDRLSDGSIHIRYPFLSQRIIHLIPGIDKASNKPTPVLNPPLLEKEGGQPRKNDFNYRSVIISFSFLTN